MKLMRMTVGLLVVVLVGCGASATKVNGPDGRDGWWAISCRRSQSNCTEKAGDVCPNGYEVSNADGREGLYADRNIIATTYNGEMLIKCKR